MGKSTAVGAFVLGALGLGALVIVLFGGQRLLTNKLRVVAYFKNSVAGLTVGAPVTLRGVRIGSVRSMKVYLKLPELIPVIPVYMEIDSGQVSWTTDPLAADATDLDMAVKAGLRAQLATQSLVTGQASVNLDFHPEIPATLTGEPDGVVEIPTIPSDLQHIRDEIADLNLPDISEKARAALSGINQLIGELTGKVGPAADSIRDTADSARSTMETTTEAVRQLQLDASRTLNSINHLAGTAEGQVVTTGKDLGRVIADLEQAATRAGKVMDDLGNMTAQRSPLRGDLEAAVRDLGASASSLRNFSRDIERNPSALLFGKSAK